MKQTLSDTKPVVVLCTAMGIYFISTLVASFVVYITAQEDIARGDYWATNLSLLVSSVLMFAVPALLMATKVNGSQGYAWRTNGTTIWQYILGGALILLAQPFAEWCLYVNERVCLWPAMQSYGFGVDKVQQARVLAAALDFSSMGGWLMAVLAVAIVPAVVEELFFRATIQNALLLLTRKPAVAVALAAVFFSAMHFEASAFLPRLVLGLVIGFIYVYTGNLWVSILAHALNNAFTLVMVYVQMGEASLVDALSEPCEDPGMLWAIASVVCLGLGFGKLKSMSRRSDDGVSEAEAEDEA